VRIADVHGQLVHRPEPRPGQLPGEAVVAEQHVADALPLRARQPRRHQRVDDIDERLHHQRPPGDEHNDALDGAAHVPDDVRPGRGDGQVEVVAERLGVGGLADDDDGVAKAGAVLLEECRVGVLGVDDVRAGGDGAPDAVEDGGPGGEVVPREALPGDGPPAALAAEVVGVAAGDQDGAVLGQRQHRAGARLAVLEEDEGLAHGLARQVAVLLLAELARQAGVGVGVVEEAHGELDAQDAAHGVVDAAHGDGAVPHQQREVVDELRVRVRDHHHVDPGQDAQLDGQEVVGVVRGRDPVQPLPVRDDETLKQHPFITNCLKHSNNRIQTTTCPEAEPVLEVVGDEEVVGVHLDAVPAGEGDHDGGDAPYDGVVVGRHVDGHEVVEGRDRVALVDALGGAAVADVVLGAGRDVAVARGDVGPAGVGRVRDLALEPGDDGGHVAHHLRVLAEALVAPAPPRVPAHRDAGSEDVGDAGGPDLQRHGSSDPPRQLWLPGAAEADVVREDGGFVHVAVAVDGVDAVDDRDPEPRRHRGALHPVHHLHPRLRRRVLRRHAAAAAEHAACSAHARPGCQDVCMYVCAYIHDTCWHACTYLRGTC
jgi:hypothetical protein